MKDNTNNKSEENFEDAENQQNENTPPHSPKFDSNPAINPNKDGEDEDNGLPSYYKSTPKKEDDSDNEDQTEEIEYSPEEKAKIAEGLVQSRQEAGKLFKESNYVQALNIYSLCLKDARKAKITDQISILYCNRGICFNKLNDKEKALKNFTKAIEKNNNYSKAIANRFLLYYNKGDFIEAMEDYNKLKEIDKVLWQTYAHMESDLQYKAETKKKQMTDEMLGKLKDLGNSFLGNFGISLDNFQMTPNGQGGYSVQYQNK